MSKELINDFHLEMLSRDVFMTNLNQRQKLICAALEHMALERAAACVLPVPDTDPPLFVAVGPATEIARLLPQQSGARRTTDLSRRLREIADQQPGWKALLDSAAEEIERYYGGMMSWKEAAEAKDVAAITAPATPFDAEVERALDAGDLVGYGRARRRQTAHIRTTAADVQHDHSEGGHHD